MTVEAFVELARLFGLPFALLLTAVLGFARGWIVPRYVLDRERELTKAESDRADRAEKRSDRWEQTAFFTAQTAKKSADLVETVVPRLLPFGD